MKINAQETEFLERVESGSELRIADRDEDKVRQRMRRLGYVEFVMIGRRWVITDAGRNALSERKGEDG